MRRTGWLAAWPAGAALGAVSVLLAHSDPDLAFADSGASVVAELLAGYALIACGLMSRRRVPGSRFGVLLAAEPWQEWRGQAVPWCVAGTTAIP
jgi:hypothetical protein